MIVHDGAPIELIEFAAKRKVVKHKLTAKQRDEASSPN